MPADALADNNLVLDFAADYQSAVAADRPADLAVICKDRRDLIPAVEEVLRDAGLLADAGRAFPPAEPDGEPMPAALGRYELQHEVGQGSFGVAYRGRDTQLNRDVAVKLLRRKWAGNEPVARRFLDEARVTAQLQHPAIPAVHEIGTDADGRPWMAMKLIRGRTLSDMARDGDPALNRLAVFEAVCQGLSYSHSKGVIHRDLKPENVMVGAFGEVQVMDWGLAKVLGSGPAAGGTGEETAGTAILSDRESDGTRAGSAVGTPAYMAPEQAIGAVDKVDRRSDVFGLGGVLCHLLTGRPPFVGGDGESTRQLAALGKVQDAFARLAACGADPELVALCKRCLSPEKADRPADAAEVAKAVAALRTAADERARRAEVDKAKAEVEVVEQRKRRRVLTRAAVIVAAVLLAGVVGTAVGLVQAREARESERTRADHEALAKEEAVAQKRLSEAATQQAREAEESTLEALRSATDEAIEQLIGSKPVLGPKEKAYLEAARARWQGFADRGGNDERSRAIRAEGLHRVALLWNKLRRPDDARSGYTAAIEIGRQLAKEFPAKPAYRSDLSTNLNNLGTLHMDLGEPVEAEPLMREGLSLREELVRAYPAVPKYQADLAASHGNLGILNRRLKRRGEAMEQYSAAIRVLKKLIDAHPKEDKYQAQKARSHSNLAVLLRDGSDREAERAENLDAIKLLTGLVAARPANPEYRDNLASAYTSLGQLCKRLNEQAAARRHFEKALELQDQLVKDFPGLAEYRIYWASTLCSFGHLLSDGGDPVRSIKEYTTAIDILSPIYAADIRATDARVILRNTYRGRANARHELREYDASLADWNEVVKLVRPQEPQYDYAARAGARLYAGNVAEAIDEVASLTRRTDWEANEWAIFALIYSAASGKLEHKKQEYGDRAMQYLRQAVKAGYADSANLAREKLFDSLRTRGDFKALVVELESKGPR